MSVEKSSFRPWNDLSGQDREQVLLLLGSLTEFAAGFNVTTSYTQFSSNPDDPPIRFLYQGLHQYLYAYYMDEPGTGALPILRAIGAVKEADEIEKILDSQMGKTTIRGFMKQWRNKIMSHPTFKVKPIVHSVYAPAEIESDEAIDFFEIALQHLCWTTLTLGSTIREVYPEAVALDKARYAPVDKST